VQVVAREALGSEIEFVPSHEPHAAGVEHLRPSMAELDGVERGEFIDPSHILGVVHMRDSRTQPNAIDRGVGGARACWESKPARSRQGWIEEPLHQPIGPWGSRLRRYRHE